MQFGITAEFACCDRIYTDIGTIETITDFLLYGRANFKIHRITNIARVYPLLALLVLATGGCWSVNPRTTIVLVDASGSIDAEEYGRCLRRIERLLDKFDRGDRLILIPITGEPAELLGRRIRTAEMPRDYAPYDGNLKRARADAAHIISQFAAELPTIRAVRSDIFGAFRAAADFVRDGNTAIFCLSDLLEDDDTIRFRTSPELRDEVAAGNLAMNRARPGMLRGAAVTVGLLRSTELERLEPERRAAVRAFWGVWLLFHDAIPVIL
ncbi:MAG: hypothetical protein KIT57_22815 [Blastocatellales bacterium]|nr:hypothetical protein [Blastocatellales bacterium]